MRTSSGQVVGNTVVLDGAVLPEGSRVTVLVESERVSAEISEQDFLDTVNEAERTRRRPEQEAIYLKLLARLQLKR